MSEHRRGFISAAFALDAVVNRVPPTTWDSPTPCPDWTGREVLGHVILALERLIGELDGPTGPPNRSEAEAAGDDPRATWTATLHATMTALDRPGALQRVVDTPFGTMTIDAVLGFLPSDLLAHTWDLAEAGGVDACLPPDLCEHFATALLAAGDIVRGPGRMDDPVVVSQDAPAADRFIAATGRRPKPSARNGADVPTWPR